MESPWLAPLALSTPLFSHLSWVTIGRLAPLNRHWRDAVAAWRRARKVVGLDRIAFANGSCCTDSVLAALARSSPRLLSLSIAGSAHPSPFLTDQGLLSLNCTNLIMLSVSDAHFLTDASFFGVAARFRRLRHLSLLCLPCVTAATIAAFAHSCPGLIALCVELCTAIEEGPALVSIARGFADLELLELPAEDDEGPEVPLVMLAHRCPKLRWLNLTNSGATDVIVEELAMMCTDLEYLNLAYAPISGNALTALALHCKRLRGLAVGSQHPDELDQYPGLELAEAWATLARGCPRLSWVRCAGLGAGVTAALRAALDGERWMMDVGDDVINDWAALELGRRVHHEQLQEEALAGSQIVTSASEGEDDSPRLR